MGVVGAGADGALTNAVFAVAGGGAGAPRPAAAAVDALF